MTFHFWNIIVNDIPIWNIIGISLEYHYEYHNIYIIILIIYEIFMIFVIFPQKLPRVLVKKSDKKNNDLINFFKIFFYLIGCIYLIEIIKDIYQITS